MTLLSRVGVVVRDAEGRLAVAFAGERCPGCDGRCGLRLGRTPALPLPSDGTGNITIGERLRVVAPAYKLHRHAALVFGLPLFVAAGGAMFADWIGWHPLWVLVATVAGLAVPLATRLVRRAEPVAVLRQGAGNRLELRC